MDINQTLWQTLCDCYQIGKAIQPPRSVTGGMQHRLYRAQSTSGEYAIKVLHAGMLAEPGRRAHYERAERLARQMADAGIPAVCALDGPKGALLSVGDSTVVLFPWREGATLPPSPSSVDAAAQIGGLLGRIHTLAPRVEESPISFTGEHTQEEWEALVCKAQQDGAAWAGALRDALPEVIRWSAEAGAAAQELAKELLWTHRDLDQKNVLWGDLRTPWLLDWEGAGPMPPALEVMGTALNWAGQAAGTPAHAPFLAFVRGYRASKELGTAEVKLAARAVPDKWLVWLKLNMKRSLVRAQADPDEYAMACGAVSHSLTTLYALAREAHMRQQWCEEC